MEVASTVETYERVPLHQMKTSTKTENTVLRLRCLGQDYNKKIPLTEYLVCCVCVLFSKAKTMLRIGTCVRFCCYNILIPSHYVRRRFPSVSALEFRC